MDFKTISNMIRIGQTIEYNIMDWMNYYSHTRIRGINIKGFNNADYLVLGISFLDKDNKELVHHLSVGVHKSNLVKNDNYREILFKLFRGMAINEDGYISKHGLKTFMD